MSEICNSPYFFDRLSFSKKEILKKLKKYLQWHTH